jgi:hypothetical protein
VATEIRYSQRCLNCQRKNGHIHSRKARTFKCRYCGFFNPGPGLKPALEKVFSPDPEPTTSVRGRPPMIKTAAAKVVPTVIRAANAAKKSKPNGHKAPSEKVEKTPRTPASAPAKREPSWWEKVVYG